MNDPCLDFTAAVTASIHGDRPLAYDLIRATAEPDVALAFAVGLTAALTRHLATNLGLPAEVLWADISLMASELTS